MNDAQHYTPKVSVRGIIIWSLVAIFYFYENVLQVSPAIMVPELMASFHITAKELGHLAAFYFYAYASMQVPVGVLIDRFGPRKLATVAILACAVGSYVFSHADQLGIAEIGRTLIGFGSAFAVVSCMKLAANWFPSDRFTFLTGLMVTIGFSGAVAGETPLALLVNHIGWRSTLFWMGHIGLALTVLTWLIVRDAPKNSPKISNGTHFSDIWKGLKFISKNRQTWLVMLYGGLIFAPTSIFGALWGVPFLMRAHHLSRPEAATMISAFYMGWVIAGPAAGLASDLMKRRKPLMWLSAVGTFCTMLALLYLPFHTHALLTGLSFSFGIFSTGFLPSFSIIREISPREATGTAIGLMNMCNMIGGALGQPLVGYFLDKQWDGAVEHGARIYSLNAYHVALAAIPVMIGMAIIIMPFIQETYCEPAEHH